MACPVGRQLWFVFGWAVHKRMNARRVLRVIGVSFVMVGSCALLAWVHFAVYGLASSMDEFQRLPLFFLFFLYETVILWWLFRPSVTRIEHPHELGWCELLYLATLVSISVAITLRCNLMEMIKGDVQCGRR